MTLNMQGSSEIKNKLKEEAEDGEKIFEKLQRPLVISCQFFSVPVPISVLLSWVSVPHGSSASQRWTVVTLCTTPTRVTSRESGSCPLHERRMDEGLPSDYKCHPSSAQGPPHFRFTFILQWIHGRWIRTDEFQLLIKTWILAENYDQRTSAYSIQRLKRIITWDFQLLPSTPVPDVTMTSQRASPDSLNMDGSAISWYAGAI